MVLVMVVAVMVGEQLVATINVMENDEILILPNS